MTLPASPLPEAHFPPLRGLILFAHGARDPAWAEPFKRLRDITQTSLPQMQVELAFLELMQPDLHTLSAQMVAQGVEDITLVPVFLGQGGHVRRDLPALVEQVKLAHPDVAMRVSEAVGENAAVLQAIAQYCVSAVDLG
jgi:sirohydrochlorin cobaltochelatase